MPRPGGHSYFRRHSPFETSTQPVAQSRLQPARFAKRGACAQGAVEVAWCYGCTCELLWHSCCCP